jgi:O-antigen chain-terminating methyltransferase
MNNLNIDKQNAVINVEEIMSQIRENIRKKKEAGLIPPDSSSMSLKSPLNHVKSPEIEFLESHCDVSVSTYNISSHQSLIGPVLVKGRHLVNGEVKRYIDPLLARQSEWNRLTCHIIERDWQHLHDLCKKVDDFSSHFTGLESKVDSFSSEVSGIGEKVTEVSHYIKSQAYSDEIKEVIRKEVQNQVRSILQFADVELKALSTFAKVIKNGTPYSSQTEGRHNQRLTYNSINYLDFEDQFRGSREDIKTRQKEFLQYFSNCNNVLDIGCGRGEFLELLREQGIMARGVDINEDMITFCLSIYLDAMLSDAITYLNTLEDGSLDGIFIDQVVEHLEPSYLVQLLELCAQKIMPGKYVVAETVNPLSLTSLANFYIDLSHIKPVHPETLKYLFAYIGLQDIDIHFSSPVCEYENLQFLPNSYDDSSVMKNFIEIYNQNIKVINSRIFGAQDYTVIGKR